MAKQGVAPSCTDGIQNGNETGVDCGGSCPNVCAVQINLPVTFEGSSYNYEVTDFGGNASTKVTDPTNPSNTVIQTIKTAGAELWAGTTIGTNTGFSSAIPITTANAKMYVKVWSPNAGIPVRLKIEDATDPTHSCETEATTTVANGWQSMEFNFANQATGTAALNTSFIFKKASIFFNFGTTGATAGEKTYYFDNVSYGSPLLGVASFSDSQIRMYPNPAASTITIDSKSTIENVAVYSILGQEVLVQQPNSKSVTMDISVLQNGIYIIKTTIDGVKSASEFVKK